VAIPSIAQAKLLARTWGAATARPRVGTRYVDPTSAACIKHGWLEPTTETGQFPNGDTFTEYDVSDAGLAALAKAIAVRVKNT
jgi:hypothetical protein